MGWDIEAIKDQCRQRARARFADADKDMLLEAIVEREAALYPFAVTLGSLNEESQRGTWVDSELFPARWDEMGDNEVAVWNPDTKKHDTTPQPDDADLHKTDYALVESLN